MAEPPTGRRSPINVLGASASVAVLGAVVVWWAVAGRHPGGVVAGAAVLVLAAAGAGAGLGLPSSRVRRGAAIGFAVGLVLAVGAVGALVVQARSVGVGGSRHVALDDRIEAAWARGDSVLAVTHLEVLVVDADGTTRAGEERSVGDHAVVASGPGAVVTEDIDGVVVLRDAEGSRVWRAEVTADGRPAEQLAVLAVDAEGRAAVRACIESSCELVGIDADGREAWRQPAVADAIGRGATVIDRPSDRDLRVAPSRLVVVGGYDAPADEAVEIDLETGESTSLGAAGAVAVVDDVVTIARVLPDGGCEVGIVRGDAPEETTSVPCDGVGDGFGTARATGTVVVHEQLAGVLGIDVASGEAAAIDGSGDVGGVRTTLAGDGVIVRESPTGIELHDILADTVVATFDDDWVLVASGPDGVVLGRELESANPFAPEELREVAVVDPASGEVCARVRLDVPFLSRASPLPGCRAVLSPTNGPDVLVG